MCGILAIVAPAGRAVGLDERTFCRMRDTLTHRGPDDAGLWTSPQAFLGHRRLSVIDPTPDGHQPMVCDDDRYGLVYNGELYNDAELRRELEAQGVRFRSQCDTETVLHALRVWGEEALRRMRGMFSLCFYDKKEHVMLAARDPLGIKPLYYAMVDDQIVFASEIPAILAHPRVTPQPNMPMVSAYLTTIRTVLGNQTLFEGVHAVEPGEVIRVDCARESLRVSATSCDTPTRVGGWISEEEAIARTLDVISDSVAAHMRSDVPLCALLSGGLDSSITASRAREHHPELRTYCAGSPGEEDDDLSWARRVSMDLGTQHTEALVDRELFLERWPELIARLGVPLSTPNEVAIYTVASRLREDGCVVTISGEGADEMFAGYEPPMDTAWRFTQEHPGSADGGLFQLESNAWIPPGLKQQIFQKGAWEAVRHDEWLLEHYAGLFAKCTEETGSEGSPIQAHLRFHQRVNLVGLLQRLDTATMHASVEGRTPFADIHVAQLANSLPEHHLYAPPPCQGEGTNSGVITVASSRTKRVLRRAFAASVPEGVAQRPKASFPLPFMSWLDGGAGLIENNALIGSLLTHEAQLAIHADPIGNWQCAWPIMNIALWSEQFWS